MPAPLDLTGRRFGRLTVLSRGPRVKWGRWQSSWLCRCDCGATVEVPQNRLPHRKTIPQSHVVDACDACRSAPCVICGAAIPPAAKSVTCSAECSAEHQRRYQIAYYHRVKKLNPDFVTKNGIRRELRMAEMSEDEKRAMRARTYRRQLEIHGRDEMNARAREYYRQRVDNDPEFAAAKRDRGQQWIEGNPEAARRHWREYARRKRAFEIARQLGGIDERMEDIENDE